MATEVGVYARIEH